MKHNLINDVVQGMLPFLNNAQNEKLREVLQYTLANYEVTQSTDKSTNSEHDFVELFLSAKHIEGCSEKSLKYYKATITSMLEEIQKDVKHIVTDDIRGYLTRYQEKNNSSKTTIDNIRRILSSFSLGWRTRTTLLKVRCAEYIRSKQHRKLKKPTPTKRWS